MKKISEILIILMTCSLSVSAFAEETLYDGLDSEIEKKNIQARQEKKRSRKSKSGISAEIKKISDLSTLSPFEDVAVISKKYMPKTKRFELSFQGQIGLNNAFFNNFGGSLSLGWYLTESLGLELSYYSLLDSERSVTENLREERQIETRSFVLPKSYYGAAIKWAPWYGKMALFEDRIVSFDWYFAPGIGYTTTEEDQELTGHLGIGQVISMNKSWAFRWDVNWNIYEATVRKKAKNQPDFFEEEVHSDLFLSVGVSWFFPGVKKR